MGEEAEIYTHLTVEIYVSAISSAHHGGVLTFLLAAVVACTLQFAFLAEASIVLFGGHGQWELRTCGCLESVRGSVGAHRDLSLV